MLLFLTTKNLQKRYADRIIRISDGVVESDVGTKNISNKCKFNLVPATLPLKYSLKMGIGTMICEKHFSYTDGQVSQMIKQTVADMVQGAKGRSI